MISLEKQAELCYNDTVQAIAKAKQRVFDVSRLVLTLQTAIMGMVFSNQITFSVYLFILPLFVGLFGIFLQYSLNNELRAHRITLARLRKEIGGFVYRLNKDQVEYYLNNEKPSYGNYFRSYECVNYMIIALSSIVTCGVALLKIEWQEIILNFGKFNLF